MKKIKIFKIFCKKIKNFYKKIVNFFDFFMKKMIKSFNFHEKLKNFTIL